MNKWIYIVIGIIIVIVAIFCGTFLFKDENKEINNNVFDINDVEHKNIVVENSIVNDIPISSVEEEKISPNATLILKKYYEQCDHTIKEYVKIPEEYVNLTKEELEKKKDDWHIESFSKDEVVLIKQLNGVCNKHYILRENNGTIVVYQVDENNNETLKEETGIAVEYLTENDRLTLEEGIRIYGDEALNSTLEDYE